MKVFVLFHVQDSNTNPLSNALIDTGVWKGKTNSCGEFWAWLDTGVYHAEISCSGYTTRKLDWDFESQPDAPVYIGLESAFPVNPPLRSAIIHIKDNFCNLRDSDDIPIFEPFIGVLITLNPNKAKDWITRAKITGQTHYDITISGDYTENLGWAGRYPIPGHDWTSDLPGFSRVLDYLIINGFIPHVHLACDGQSNPFGGYNDPSGLTYGWGWGMANLPRIMNQLQRYWPYCLWCSGYDGCFPDWSPQQTIQWIHMMKGISPNINISTEFSGPGSVGYSHMGNAGVDWASDKLGMLDAFLIELSNIPPNVEGVQQTASRLLGPKSKNIDLVNAGPYYLAGLGKDIGICMYETCAYQAIRKRVTPDDAVGAARVCADYGFSDFGNGLVS